MKEEKHQITTSNKINESPWKKEKIITLLGLYRAKFFQKLKYNDWDEKEIVILKNNRVIE